MRSELIKKIQNAIEVAGYVFPVDFSLEQTPKPEMGDFATNVAMIIAGNEKKNPREVAEKIKNELEKYDDIIKVEIAGPGFINIILNQDIYLAELAKIVDQKENYGRSSAGQGKKVNVEYISANPTGPLHIGNARSGPIGEAIANLLEFNSTDVTREFYVNDIGGQIAKFGKSLYHWYAIRSNSQKEFPEGGYPGLYVKETSELIQSEFKDEVADLKSESDKITFFAQKGLELMVEGIRIDAEMIGIKFDQWSFESEVLKSGKSQDVIEKLKSHGFTVEKEGAIWFKNPDDPELKDKESVLVKSDETGSLTYFANDLAYHVDKANRGAGQLIDIWGANQSGHIPRMQAALRALGYEDVLHIVLYQYVRLKKSGQAMSMGKRLGNFVTPRQLVEAGVEPDAFKYFILAQNPNTPMDFDVDLAADTSEKNPVYYIKYAHARICSIIAKTGISGHSEARAEESQRSFANAQDDNSMGGSEGVDFNSANLTLLENPKEIALYKELIKFPEIITDISINFQIQVLPHFAYKIAGLFHDFYSTCRVIGAETKELEQARLSLILATKYVLKNCLNILGIEAPEHM